MKVHCERCGREERISKERAEDGVRCSSCLRIMKPGPARKLPPGMKRR